MLTKVGAEQRPVQPFSPERGGYLQRKCACGGTPDPTGECAECRQKRLQRRQQRRPDTPLEPSPETSVVHEILGPSGRSLDPATRSFMEPRFGHDFSRVRTHTDARAAESARAVGARAYTVGHDVVFGAGRYAPHTAAGQRLLAHELAHVVQQQAAGPSLQPDLVASRAGDVAEQEAEAVAEQVTGGHPVRVRQSARTTLQGDWLGAGIGALVGGGVGAAIGSIFGPIGALVGLGVGALAGAIIGGLTGGSPERNGTWSIAQTNTDGPNYSSDVNITFTPRAERVNCSEIAFVQTVKFSDVSTGASVETIPNYVSRRTGSGWTLDRIEARQYGWYGYNNDGSPSGNVSPGSSPAPLTPATLHDTPSDVRPDSVFEFETCAICRTGTDLNSIYGCFTWGFNVDSSNRLTSRRNERRAGPSADFAESVKQWNIQAAGPGASRNDPSQQPLGPFRE